MRTADTQVEIPRVGVARSRAGVTIATHFVVDVFSFVGISLLPVLVVQLGLETYQKALLLALGSVTSGLVQPIVAWVSDRFDTRTVGTIGFVVAIACIGNLGVAENFNQLLVLYCLGAMGVGAFHPIAASTVGQLAGSKRSLWIAYFFLAGMIGGVTGNIFTPRFVKWMSMNSDGVVDTHAGLMGLRWFIPVGLVFAGLLAIAIHRVGHRTQNAHELTVSWDRKERRLRWRSVWILYSANVLRFSVNMALVYLFSEWAEFYASSNASAGLSTDAIGIAAARTNGFLQASMQVGMGGGGILLGIFLSPRFEKISFVLVPVLGALAVVMIPWIGRWAPGSALGVTMIAAVFSGVGFGAMIPVSMSLAQKLLPHRTSLASGLMLGGAWMLAFVGPLLAEVIQYGLESKPGTPGFVIELVGLLPDGLRDACMNGVGLFGAFTATSFALIGAGCISFFLPGELIRRCSAH
ncbi:MAG: MFS transporter [Phycisphaerales bacterium]|nr:MFS transporter [Phycisphaerales bacterium]